MQSNLIFSITALLVLSACGSSGDSEDGSNAVLADFCTGMEDASQPDFDADGLSDNCDDDDDGDGFNDVSDIAPLDPAQPGDFSTPEAILMQPVITQVLDELANQNILLNLELGTNPPDISGLYRIEDLSGMVVGSSNGQRIGQAFVGSERKALVEGDKVFRSSVSFNNNQPSGFSVSSGANIRGDGDAYSTYSTTNSTCTLDGANFSISSVGLLSAQINPSTGDIVNSRSIGITVGVSGELNDACESFFSGGRTNVGGWLIGDNGVGASVTTDSIQFMCVSEAQAYAPTESWSRSDGASCECSQNYETICVR